MKLQRITVILLAAITIGLLSVAIKLAQPVVMPLVIALLFSLMLSPVVKLLGRHHIPKAVAIIILILLMLGLVYLIGMFFFSSIQSFIGIFPKYQAKLQILLDNSMTTLNQRFGVPIDLLDDFEWSKIVRDYLLSLSGGFIGFMKNFFVITIFLVFLLLELPFMKQKLTAAFESKTSDRIGRVVEHINQQIARYLALKILISASTGFVIWLSLEIIGMDFPVVWGLLGFVLNFIPNIGSTLHWAITSIMAVVQFVPGEGGKALAVALALFGIQTLIGNIMDPRLQGHRLDLSPFLVLFSLILWGWLWGAVGMLLSTPITVAIKIVCANIPVLRPVSVLMGKGYGRHSPSKEDLDPLVEPSDA